MESQQKVNEENAVGILKGLLRRPKEIIGYIGTIWFVAFGSGALVYEANQNLANDYAQALAYFTYVTLGAIIVIIGGSKYIAYSNLKKRKNKLFVSIYHLLFVKLICYFL